MAQRQAVPGPRGRPERGGRSTRGQQRQKRYRPEIAATVITVIGLFIVAVLAVQASGSSSASGVAAGGTSTASPHPTATATGSRSPTDPQVPPVPANSGTGKRLVYSVGQKRVWLVGADGTTAATFTGSDGSELPSMGTHVVDNHARHGFGSDGVFIQYVTYFGQTSNGYDLAFDTTDLTTPTATPTSGPFEPVGAVTATPIGKTGAIRVSLDEANLIYHFATLNTSVVVVG